MHLAEFENTIPYFGR